MGLRSRCQILLLAAHRGADYKTQEYEPISIFWAIFNHDFSSYFLEQILIFRAILRSKSKNSAKIKLHILYFCGLSLQISSLSDV